MTSPFFALLAGFALCGAGLLSCEDTSSGPRERRIAPPASAGRITDGTVYTLRLGGEISPDGTRRPVTSSSASHVMRTLQARLDPDHEGGIHIKLQGDDLIVVEVPRLEESKAASIARSIRATGKLELRAVHPENSTLAETVRSGETIVPGYELFEYHYDDWHTGEARTEHLLLSKRVQVSGKHVKSAAPDAGQKGVVNIRLSNEGGDRMIRLTKDMTPGRDRIAVVLDDTVMSAPVIRSVPLGSNFIIEGLDSHEEARDLAVALMNPLSNPLEIVSVVEKTTAPPSPDNSSNTDSSPEDPSNN